MASASEVVCPQCNIIINDNTNRLIKEVCGHDKCRQCFINENNGCQICTKEAIISPDNQNSRQPEIFKLKTGWVNKLSNQHKSSEFSDDSNYLTIDTDTESNSEATQKTQCDVINTHEMLNNKSIGIIVPDHIKVKTKKEKISNAHISQKTENSKIVYHCSICDKNFTSQRLKRYHLYCNKCNLNPYKCDECEKEYKNMFHLKWHKSKKHKSSPLYPCELCNKTFPTKYELTRHIKSHSRIGLSCHQCNETFANRSSLYEHSLKHDKDTFKHNCEICNTKYRLRCNLLKHLKTHEKITPVKCDSCPLQFSTSANMLEHAKKHERKSALECNICQKTFADRTTLSRHAKLHQAESGYFCKICDMKSARKDNIVRHCRSFHPGQTDVVGKVEKKEKIIYSVIYITEPKVDNHVSVIKSIGKPITKLHTDEDVISTEENVIAQKSMEFDPVEAPILASATISKPAETMKCSSEPTNNLDLYRAILSPFPTKPVEGSTLLEKATISEISERPLPVVTVQPRGLKAKKYDPLEIYRKILEPSKNDDSKPVGVENNLSNPEIKNGGSSSQFNFNEIHWRKRTSQSFMFK